MNQWARHKEIAYASKSMSYAKVRGKNADGKAEFSFALDAGVSVFRCDESISTVNTRVVGEYSEDTRI